MITASHKLYSDYDHLLAKETVHFEITVNNIKVFLETLRMFGILSKNHKHDILQIINTILAG